MDRRLTTGLILPNRGPMIGATTVPELLDLAAAADASGWDSVWVGDSILAKPRVEALVMLSAVAARTTRVSLGAACLASTPLRDPLLLAHQWASLDHLSGGRTIFVACQGGGPGMGEFDNELANFGVERSSRPRRVEEAIEILRRLWSEDDVDYDGTFTSLRGVTIRPRPAQPRIPVWIAANPDLSKARNVATAFGRVARYADGWQVTHTRPAGVARALEIIHEHADAIGRTLPDDFDVCVCMNICVDDDREKAFAEAKRFLDAHSRTEYTQEFLETWVAAGPAEACLETLHDYVRAGATSILLRISSFDQRGQFERITEEVVPYLSAR